MCHSIMRCTPSLMDSHHYSISLSPVSPLGIWSLFSCESHCQLQNHLSVLGPYFQHKDPIFDIFCSCHKINSPWVVYPASREGILCNNTYARKHMLSVGSTAPLSIRPESPSPYLDSTSYSVAVCESHSTLLQPNAHALFIACQAPVRAKMHWRISSLHNT